jgi:hypothetical protein
MAPEHYERFLGRNTRSTRNSIASIHSHGSSALCRGNDYFNQFVKSTNSQLFKYSQQKKFQKFVPQSEAIQQSSSERYKFYIKQMDKRELEEET